MSSFYILLWGSPLTVVFFEKPDILNAIIAYFRMNWTENITIKRDIADIISMVEIYSSPFIVFPVKFVV